MTQPDPSHLNALLGSRICHDLISPLGAIGNGVELLQMTGMGDSAEMTLIADSVEAANARVRLFRIAFGAAEDGQVLSRAELRAVTGHIGADRRMQIDWTPPERLDRRQAKLAILLLLAAETLLPYGGRVEMLTDGDRISLGLAAERMRRDRELLSQLTEPGAALPEASEIHFPLARIAAATIGRQISVAAEDPQRLVLAA